MQRLSLIFKLLGCGGARLVEEIMLISIEYPPFQPRRVLTLKVLLGHARVARSYP